jgi:hypothetical protein
MAYQTAFGHLLDGLMVITLLCALAAFAFLSRVRVQDEPLATREGETPFSRETGSLVTELEISEINAG